MAQAIAPASIGNSEFDRDTAVSRRGPGVFDASLSEGWTIINAVNGGYLLALVGRALGEELPHSDPFSITAHYLTASRPGPAEIRTETIRAGRTLSTGQATLVQYDAQGAPVERLRVLASYGDLGALDPEVRTSAKPPVLPPVEQCLGASDAPDGKVVPGSNAITERLLLKLDPATIGWAVGQPSGKGEARAWFGLADGRDPDPLSLLLAVDALPPTAFDLGLMGWMPTVELTVHVRHRPAPGPLRVAVATRNLAHGFLEEDAEVWDSADRLVAQSRQLARVVQPG
ncbi:MULTISPECIES: thioesterase family protein [unclassified Streptomyces]|uniref:thioesterase family protein n=1 Tax=unclassified Streptomyces TaxID=2593676 RepID=UPI00081EB048|nr:MULTISPECIES: thioesterase family protein [unclassified Streptomyces]MYR29209.1 thioesterase family protein [Streptomyces sp. SID4945]SCF44787.1 Thioesterase-like superfamily protein [Streptomyces sp. LcepLS]